MTISPPESGEKNKKVLEDPVKADPRPIDFAKLDKPGFWSSKLSKGPKLQLGSGICMLTHMILMCIQAMLKKQQEKSSQLILDILQSFLYG